MSIQLSACYSGYNRQTTVEEAVKRIAIAGYKAVVFTPARRTRGHKIIRRQSERLSRNKFLILGLNCTGLCGSRCVSGSASPNFSSPRESIRKMTVQYYLDNIRLAEELGCPLMNVLTGHVLYGTSKEQARKWTMDALQQLVGEAEKTKFMLGLHPQYIAESPLMITVDDALDMIKDLIFVCQDHL